MTQYVYCDAGGIPDIMSERAWRALRRIVCIDAEGEDNPHAVNELDAATCDLEHYCQGRTTERDTWDALAACGSERARRAVIHCLLGQCGDDTAGRITVRETFRAARRAGFEDWNSVHRSRITGGQNP